MLLIWWVKVYDEVNLNILVANSIVLWSINAQQQLNLSEYIFNEVHQDSPVVSHKVSTLKFASAVIQSSWALLFIYYRASTYILAM